MNLLNTSRNDPSYTRQLPVNLLETFVPGFGSISTFLLEVLGFDVTIWVSTAFLIFAIAKSVDVLQRQISSLLLRWATCSVSFDSQSDAYNWIVEYLSAKGIGESYHDLIAISSYTDPSSKHEVGYELNGQYYAPGEPLPKTDSSVIYEPSIGSSQYFWHNGRLFMWYRWQVYQPSSYHAPSPEVTRGRLYCFSRKTDPIKTLVDEAMKLYEKQTATKTTIRRPAPSHQRRRGGNPWVKVASRISRALESVIIEQEAKTRVVTDMSEFLSMKTKRWYADRGIPHRRGYLFSGPPGTGKTSLSFALAGSFGINIYCISLAEPSLTEEDLAKLFDNLPEQSIVLLEDIDVAGLPVRGGMSKLSDLEVSKSSSTEAAEANARISLSGLLNVVDGVAASEGRILIMTTNDASDIDEALLRPGRIDHKVNFQRASKSDAGVLFHQIYCDKIDPSEELKKDQRKDKSKREDERVQKLAAAFSEKIPDRALGQAEIQGYLMQYKEDPDEAIFRTDEWLASLRKDI